MKQYLVTALDFTDENALSRRMEARPLHLESALKLKETGNFIIGGAILNDKGNMCGSSLIMQFESEDELKNWLEAEPYIRQNVWEKVEWKLFKLAQI